MRSIHKKAACLLSSAVLLCGANVMTAGAARTPTHGRNIIVGTSAEEMQATGRT